MGVVGRALLHLSFTPPFDSRVIRSVWVSRQHRVHIAQNFFVEAQNNPCLYFALHLIALGPWLLLVWYIRIRGHILRFMNIQKSVISDKLATKVDETHEVELVKQPFPSFTKMNQRDPALLQNVELWMFGTASPVPLVNLWSGAVSITMLSML